MKEATSSGREYRASHLYGWASSNCILSRCGNFHISTYLLIGGTTQAPIITHMYTHTYISVYAQVYNKHDGVCKLEKGSGNLYAFQVGAQEYSADPSFHSVFWVQHQGWPPGQLKNETLSEAPMGQPLGWMPFSGSAMYSATKFLTEGSMGRSLKPCQCTDNDNLTHQPKMGKDTLYTRNKRQKGNMMVLGAVSCRPNEWLIGTCQGFLGIHSSNKHSGCIWSLSFNNALTRYKQATLRKESAPYRRLWDHRA